MAHTPDVFDSDLDSEGDGGGGRGSPTCNRCEKGGLEWIHTGLRWRLFEENGKPHQCETPGSADDFDVIA